MSNRAASRLLRNTTVLRESYHGVSQFLLVFVLVTTACRNGHTAANRFWLAAQYDWGSQKGFYFNFENTSDGDVEPSSRPSGGTVRDVPCKIASLKLIIGVGDGKNWRFLFAPSTWQFDHEYKTRAFISSQVAELWLDGVSAGKSKGAFAPQEGPVMANYIPGWANGRAEYLILQTSLKLVASGKQPLNVSFARETSRPLPLMLFEPQVAKNITWNTNANDTLTLEATFRIVRYPRLQDLAPFIDRYGQCRYAEWPEKVHGDQDLKMSLAEENRRLKLWGEPKGYDRFGGFRLARWREKATGFYQVVKRNGFWWLISPDGNPCFYIGICGGPQLNWEQTPVTDREFLFEWLPPKEPPYATAWAKNSWGTNDGAEYVAFQAANMIRKYGEGWDRKATEMTGRQLKAWGFSGFGKWGGMEGLPEAPVLGHWEVPNIARHPDVFDPEVRTKFKDVLRKQIEPRRSDPFVIGWSLGNEYDEIITKGEIQDILNKPDAAPAKRALLEFAREKLQGQPDLERLRRFYAERYYEFIYRTVKELDPHHLYLGFWIVPGWWENEEDWRLAAPYCDVIGYDRYAPEFADATLNKLMQESDKPVLCGEFSFPAWYGGARGFGLYGTWCEDDTASGEAYQRWVETAAKNPCCVGLFWFLYRDQPLTGRGPGRGPSLVHGEHYAFGVVDVTDRPKWNLIQRMREANRGAVVRRLQTTKK